MHDLFRCSSKPLCPAWSPSRAHRLLPQSRMSAPRRVLGSVLTIKTWVGIVIQGLPNGLNGKARIAYNSVSAMSATRKPKNLRRNVHECQRPSILRRRAPSSVHHRSLLLDPACNRVINPVWQQLRVRVLRISACTMLS